MRSIIIAAGFLFGLSTAIPTDLTGNLCVGELLAVLLVPIAYIWINKSKYRGNVFTMVKCLFALSIWQMLIDGIHNTPFQKTLEIIGTLGFTGIKLLVFSGLFSKNGNFCGPVLAGMAVGNYIFLREFVTSSAIMEAEYWDLKVATWAGPLLLSGLIIFGRYSIAISMFAGIMYGCAAGYYGARSHGICIIIGSITPWLILVLKRTSMFGEMRSATKIISLAVVGIFLATFIYVESAKLGLLTRKSQEQIETIENPYNPIQIALSARGGTVLGVIGALEHPFIGFGSKEFYTDLYIEAGLPNNYGSIHSVIVESMAYGGILTLLFWWIFFRNVFVMYPPTSRNHSELLYFNVVASIVVVLLLWSSCFSPFVSSRLDFPILIATLLHCDLYRNSHLSNLQTIKQQEQLRHRS